MIGPGMTDEQLLARAGHDPVAFEELYKRHVSKVVGFAVRRCARADDVPDLVAAVWLEVIESAHNFNPAKGRALPWLLGIAAHLAASEARRKKREEQARRRLAGRRIVDEDDFVRLEEQMDASGVTAALRQALANLPDGERAVVELVVLDGFSPAGAAQALGIRSATARMRLARGRMKIRRSLPSFLSQATCPPPFAKEVSREFLG